MRSRWLLGFIVHHHAHCRGSSSPYGAFRCARPCPPLGPVAVHAQPEALARPPRLCSSAGPPAAKHRCHLPVHLRAAGGGRGPDLQRHEPPGLHPPNPNGQPQWWPKAGLGQKELCQPWVRLTERNCLTGRVFQCISEPVRFGMQRHPPRKWLGCGLAPFVIANLSSFWRQLFMLILEKIQSFLNFHIFEKFLLKMCTNEPPQRMTFKKRWIRTGGGAWGRYSCRQTFQPTKILYASYCRCTRYTHSYIHIYFET